MSDLPNKQVPRRDFLLQLLAVASASAVGAPLPADAPRATKDFRD
jgi:hypothetical protein